jgi:hypothetical protein
MKNNSLLLLMLLSLNAQSQPPKDRKPPSPEERLKHVTERMNHELTMTPAQQTKLTAAYKDFFKAMDALRSKDGRQAPPPPPPPPADKAVVDKLVKARDAKIKATLNPEQFKKYSELEKSMRPPPPRD